TSDAASYSVTVSDPDGQVTSSNAVLTVIPASVALPLGAVSWRPGNSNAIDVFSGNNGTWVGLPDYEAGVFAQAFEFDGSTTGITVSNRSNLQLQDFTIEAWIKRSIRTTMSLSPAGYDSFVFGYGQDGYAFTIDPSGRFYLTKVGVNNVSVANLVTNTD